jgi:multiple sugar transport system substrate-binding protein
MQLVNVCVVLASIVSLGCARASAQETLTVWFTKAYYPAEDEALQRVIDKFERKTGVKVELSLFTPEDIVIKSVSAVEAGRPPDVGFGLTYDFRVAGKWAYEGKLEDLSPILNPIASEFLPGTLSTVHLVNGKTGQRSYYAAPIEQQLLHAFYWADMVQEAGFRENEIPTTWLAYWDFWCDKVQAGLRKKGQRIYGIGQPASVQGTDPIYGFLTWANAYDAQIVDTNGDLVLEQPKNRAAIAKALAHYTSIVVRGCSPASSINWTDADNNINFNNRTTVMTHNASLSIPGAHLDAMSRPTLTPGEKAQERKNYYELIRTTPLPNKVSGDRLPSLAAVKAAVVFAGARNKKRGMEFLAFLLQEENLTPYVEGSLGRWLPVTKRALERPFWTDGADPHRAVARKQLAAGTVPFPFVYNWKFTVINAENVWGRAMARIIKDRVAPDKAADEMIARIKQILAE